MLRRAFASGVVVATATTAFLGLGLAPAAAETVKSTPSTLTVTLTTADNAQIVVNASGDVEVSTGGPVNTYDGRTNLVVNAFDGLSVVEVVLIGDLAGSLTVNLPGENTLGVFGSANPDIGKDLKIVGSDDAGQLIILGLNFSLEIGRHLSIDTGLGTDGFVVDVLNSVSVGGNLKTAGLDGALILGSLGVLGTATISTKAEGEASRWDIEAPFSVGKNFTFNGGPSSDQFFVPFLGRTDFGANATFNLFDNKVNSDEQLVKIGPGTVQGNLKVNAGAAVRNVFTSDSQTFYNKGVNVKLNGTDNHATFWRGGLTGNVTYTGANAGRDEVSIIEFDAPAAKVVVNTKGGDDSLSLFGAVNIAKLTANMGAGTDTFSDGGNTLPPGSSVKGLP